MLRPVPLVDQFRRIEGDLLEDWSDARLQLTVADPAKAARATALLGATGAGRSGNTIRFHSARRGAGIGPEGVRRLLRKLDEEGIRGELELLAAGKPAVVPPTHRRTFVESWDGALGALPSDWSELFCELGLNSTDYLERAALLTAPLNPSRFDDTPGFRFRVASHAGYGASPDMVRRCLQRLDENGIRGEIGVLRVLSASNHVATQGPVWYVGGRAV
ncbi:MAG: hypothetical protein QOK13_1162 [Gaiellaceae bacterium]|jgi:hypothetical protein|nr:hypothetical protein [Gaiellaceae bacterium]MDX6488547.1 hypothetical protein [Gaiellaceae bacterium]MDX6542488.1 hypothetical protein [Gaiellaceae bacterium]